MNLTHDWSPHVLSLYQRQDNIETLLQLLETSDFYPRLYSLQLITAINAARPERTQECVLNAALGASRLASTLDDGRDAVRNAGLVLLSDLTVVSTDLQKLIAFEDIFDRVFNLIKLEGGLVEGSIVVQDCLELLANLLRYNPSNQSLFRESGCTPKLAELVGEKERSNQGAEGDSWPTPQGDKNIWGLLSVVRLFLMRGSAGTPASQTIFVRHGILQRVLNLAFDATVPTAIKAEALHTCADMIRGNPDIQATFAGSEVAVPVPSPATPGATPNGVNGTMETTYIIDALLDLILNPPTNTVFEIRLAACECLKAYFFGHSRIKSHFLQRAIEGHSAGEDETPNVLSTLIRENPALHKISDPHRIWFAAVIVLHLIWDDAEGKKALMNVAEGDASEGEEVVTFIQGVAANLVSSLQNNEDERILLAYFMLLSGLLFEDPAAVDDFLSEGSTVQFLMQTAKSNHERRTLIKGMCILLLGLSYEYSTKDSPIPRRKLHDVLQSGLGREMYIQTLEKLRQHPLIREFEIQSANSAPVSAEYELPAFAYLDETFVEFLKDNFSRFRRAIDRDPGLEVQIASGKEGVDRDVLDTLRAEIEEKRSAVDKLNASVIELESKFSLEQTAHRKTQESTASDLARIKQINEALQRNHEAEVASAQQSHDNLRKQLEASSQKRIQELLDQLARIQKDSTDQAERSKDYYERSINQLRAAKKELEVRNAELKQQGEAKAGEIGTFKSREARLREDISSIQSQLNTKQSTIDQQKAQLQSLDLARTQAEESAEDERTKNAMLEKEVSELLSKTKALEGAKSAAEAAAKQSATQLAEQAKSTADQKKDLATKEADLKSSNEKFNEQAKKLKATEDKLQSLESQLKDAEAKLKTAESKAKEAEQKLQEATKKSASDKKSTNKESDKALQDLQKKLTESENAAKALKSQQEKDKTSHQESGKTIKDLQKKLADSEKALKTLKDEQGKQKKAPAADAAHEKAVQELQKKLDASEKALKEERDGRTTTQTELDDLLLVFADLEEKNTKNKVRFFGCA